LERVLGPNADRSKIETIVKQSKHQGVPRFELHTHPRRGTFIRATGGHTFDSQGGRYGDDHFNSADDPEEDDEETDAMSDSPRSTETLTAWQSEPSTVMTNVPSGPWPPPPPPGSPPETDEQSSRPKSQPPKVVCTETTEPTPCEPQVMEPQLMEPELTEPQSMEPQLMVVGASFPGYTWGPEYLQVNSPTCDGVIGNEFTFLPHPEKHDNWTYGCFEGGRSGWLPSDYLGPCEPEKTCEDAEGKLNSANEQAEKLEAEVAHLRRLVQQAGVKKHEF